MSAPCRAYEFAESWNSGDSFRAAGFGALHLADWAQTRYGVEHPDKFKEYNHSLGEHPSRKDVNRFFAQGVLVYGLASLILPPDWRRPFQYLVIGYKASTVERNYQAGAKFEF